MIRLHKSPEPKVLIEFGSLWTNLLIEKQALGESPTLVERTRYRNPQIKDALVKETHGKCAYCESKLKHIHHGDDEHIVPKSLKLEKILQWENLTLACEICNQNKSDRDPDADNLIDPYAVEPKDHLIFVGPFIFDKGTPLGISSRVILDLGRPELFEIRKERMDYIMLLFAQICRSDIPIDVRQVLLADLRNEAKPPRPYSAMVENLIDSLIPNAPQEVLAG